MAHFAAGQSHMLMTWESCFVTKVRGFNCYAQYSHIILPRIPNSKDPPKRYIPPVFQTLPTIVSPVTQNSYRQPIRMKEKNEHTRP